MNKVILMGRLTRDPEVRYSQGERSMAIARYTLAVDRRFKRDNEPTADFIPCVAFGRQGEFAERYFKKGMRVVVTGRIQTGSYENQEGRRVYTTDIIVEDQEFAESKSANEEIRRNQGSDSYEQARPQQSSYEQAPAPAPAEDPGDGFMNIPEGINEELPFS